jgi:competence protein ComEC
MSMVAGGSELAGRRGHALSSVSIVSCCMCLARPSCSGDVGFLLSVASVIGITLLGSYVSYACEVLFRLPWPHGTPSWVRRRVESFARAARSSIAITLVAQLATIPVTVPLFGRLSLVAPLSNLVMGPLFTVLLGVGLMACCLCAVPFVGSVALAASDVICSLVCRIAHRLAGIPLASIPVVADEGLLWAVCAGIVVAIVVFWPPLTRRRIGVPVVVMFAVVLACFVRWRYLVPPRVCVLDVGQGDAILIQDGGRAILVDAGPEDAVVDALAREHVFHLDAIVITHLHDDHYGGVGHLEGAVDVDAVYVGEGVSDDEPTELAEAIEDLTGGGARELGYHDVMRVGGFVLTVISPTDETDGSENADSVEMTLAFDEGGREMSGLLTGDAEQEQMAGLLERGEVADVDFLKVGHHGSEVSLTSEQARELAPEVSVASAGEGNSYGHPSPACVEVLEDAGSLFVCTIQAGDVELRPDVGGIRMSY